MFLLIRTFGSLARGKRFPSVDIAFRSTVGISIPDASPLASDRRNSYAFFARRTRAGQTVAGAPAPILSVSEVSINENKGGPGHGDMAIRKFNLPAGARPFPNDPLEPRHEFFGPPRAS